MFVSNMVYYTHVWIFYNVGRNTAAYFAQSLGLWTTWCSCYHKHHYSFFIYVTLI